MLREHLVTLTKELIRFPSHVDEMQKNTEILDFIKSYFEKDKVVLRSYTFAGSPALIVTFEDTKHPNVFFVGHADVIATGTNFTAEERDGKLFGTGAMDMKGGLACMMAVMKHFATQKERPSLGLMITTDEETGGFNGVKSLLDNEGFRCNFAVINEGRDAYDIVLLEKGRIDLKLIKRAESAHSAYPWRTENAIESLMKSILDMRKVFPRAASEWMTVGTTTVFKAGSESASNVIPDKAEAIFTMRHTGDPKWTSDDVIDKVKKHLPDDIEVKILRCEGVARSDADNPYVHVLKDVAEKVVGKKMKYGENHGGSDARFFGEQRIPFAILGPTGHGHHSPDEYANIDSFVTHATVLRDFIKAVPKEMHTPVEKLR